MAHTSNPSTKEVEAKGSDVEHHLLQHRKLNASLGNTGVLSHGWKYCWILTVENIRYHGNTIDNFSHCAWN